MNIKDLKIPEDVEVKLCINGEVDFTFNSEKGKEKVSKMGDIEKLKFAIAVMAKITNKDDGDDEDAPIKVKYSDLDWKGATYGTLMAKANNYLVYFNQYDDVYSVSHEGETLFSLLDRANREEMLEFINKPTGKVA